MKTATLETLEISFVVYGKPAQMGSKRAFVRNGRAIMVNDNSDRLRQWYNACASRAAEEMNGDDLIKSPVQIEVDFHFRRPKSHFGTGRNAGVLKDSAPDQHSQKPDIDKLVRCLLDSLSGVIWQDDSQVFSLTARRHWTSSQERAELTITA